MKCASFFTGIGGIDKGFRQAGFETVFASDIDKQAGQTFKENFDTPFLLKDIQELENKDIPNFNIMLAGFPCQAFSITGNRAGFYDKKGRGRLFFELIRIIKERKPDILFFENVKNLVTHDKGKTLATILQAIEKFGYYTKYQVLNASKYGLPQRRERVYILAFQSHNAYQKFEFPKEEPLNTSLADYIDFAKPQDSKYYYTEKSSFYQKLRIGITKSNTCYQWRRSYVRENKKNLCPTLTANMGTGGNNVPIIKMYDESIRKLTTKECLALQGFKDFRIPANLSNTAIYKQIGNSVAVPVIAKIALQVKDCI